MTTHLPFGQFTVVTHRDTIEPTPLPRSPLPCLLGADILETQETPPGAPFAVDQLQGIFTKMRAVMIHVPLARRNLPLTVPAPVGRRGPDEIAGLVLDKRIKLLSPLSGKARIARHGWWCKENGHPGAVVW